MELEKASWAAAVRPAASGANSPEGSLAAVRFGSCPSDALAVMASTGNSAAGQTPSPLTTGKAIKSANSQASTASAAPPAPASRPKVQQASPNPSPFLPPAFSPKSSPRRRRDSMSAMNSASASSPGCTGGTAAKRRSSFPTASLERQTCWFRPPSRSSPTRPRS